MTIDEAQVRRGGTVTLLDINVEPMSKDSFDREQRALREDVGDNDFFGLNDDDFLLDQRFRRSKG